jgi:hypothetical protein
MKRLLLVLGVACLVNITGAGVSYAETKTGAARFTAAGNESIKVALGNKVKFDATFQPITVGTISAISVRGNVNNTTNGKLHYAYFVAFLDKDKNLVGCQHNILFVEGGKQGTVGTFIQLPPEQIARIAFYSVAFYEGEKAIGSR